MVDFSLPVSKRTRLGRTMAGDDQQQRKKRRKKSKADSASDNARRAGRISRDGGMGVYSSENCSVNRRVKVEPVASVGSGDESVEEIDAGVFGRESGDSVTFGVVGSESSEMKKNVKGFCTLGVKKGNAELIDLEEEVILIDEEEGFDSVNSNGSISRPVAVADDDGKGGVFVNDLDNEDGSSGLNSTGKGKEAVGISPNQNLGGSISLDSNACESGGCSYKTEPTCCSGDDDDDDEDVEESSSSEEDNEASSDGNYVLDDTNESCSESSGSESSNSESSNSESSSSENGKNSRSRVEGGSRRGRKKGGNFVEGGLRRRKAYGLDLLVDLDKDEMTSNYESENVEFGGRVNCVAQRTRSRFGLRAGKMNTNLGTFSQPFCIDDDEEGEGSDFQSGEKELDSSSKDDIGDSCDSDSPDDEIYKPKAWSSSEERDQFNDQSDDDILSRKEEDDILSRKEEDDILLRKEDDDILSRKKEDDILSRKKDDGTSKGKSFQGGSKLWNSKSLPKKNKRNQSEDCEDFQKVQPKKCHGFYNIVKKERNQSEDCEDFQKVHSKNCHDFDNINETKCKQSEDHEDFRKVHPKNCHGFDNISKAKRNQSEDCEDFQKVHSKNCYGFGDTVKTKSRRASRRKSINVFDILVDSIVTDKELPLDEFDLPTSQFASEFPLPLKFNFGYKESHLPEKSEEEKELDKLWAELDFGLRSCEIGVMDSNTVESEEAFSSKVEQVDRCRHGDHQLILDEEIGLRCRCCSYVKLEIKNIVPSFDTNPHGKSRKRESGSSKRVRFDDLQQDSDCDPHERSDSQSHFGRTVWDIIPGIRDSMYPHQCEGFEFIWKNVAGGIHLDELREKSSLNNGSGCMVSHAPGTGKTRLTIAFLQTYMELNPTCRPMIIAPCSMLLTWEEEFLKWKVGIPFHNLNKREFTHKENISAVKLLMQASPLRENPDEVRLVKLLSWKKEKSILGISYRLFGLLAGIKKNSKYNEVGNVLLDLPDLVVFDEGHIPRNNESIIWNALSRLKTERRIILSGTPFQNNFTEFNNTLSLVRPKFAEESNLGGAECLDKKRGRPKNNSRGKWDLLINSIGKNSEDGLENDKLKQIRDMINPFVHVYRGSILQEKLPGLKKSIVILHPAELQKSYLQSISRKYSFEVEYAESLISVHPSLMLKCDKGEFFVDKDMLERVRLNPELGVKIQLLLEIIRLSEALKEKVLVFSQYLEPLSFIEEHLKSHFNWSDGTEVVHMDGKGKMKKRQAVINTFNDPTSEARVLLASTKACSEGINLVGASRVVLLDVVWNPSVERQAICRAYRLGQKKIVYVYHLITSGTREEEKYSRQVEKDRLSELVFSPEHSSNQVNVTSTDLDDKVLEAVLQHEKLKNIFQKIAYQSKESSMKGNFGLADQE